MSKQQIKVFISYAHDDEPYFKVFAKTLRTQLKSRQQFEYTIWDDNHIYIGSIWDDAIKKKIADSDLAILCISDSFLASDYIKAKEFGVLIKSFPKTLLAPFLLSPCDFTEWDELAARQVFIPKGERYKEARNEDFTFADLVEFSKDDKTLIPNINIDRYIKDFIAKIEEALKERPEVPSFKKNVINISGSRYINPINYPYFEKDSFFGRDELLRQIDEKIKTIDLPLFLSGIGGMGKTAIAIAYGKDDKFYTYYNNIAWVDVNENIFSNLFSAFHSNPVIPFDYSPDGDRSKDIAKLMELLETLPGNNLLLIDNVNDEKDLQQFISTWKTYKPAWKCMITTRCNSNAYKNHLMEVQVISLKAAEELFKRHNNENFDEKSFKDIYDYIGGHTFLIELLAKFGQESSAINSTTEILEYLKVKGIKAFKGKVTAKQSQQQETDKVVSEFVMSLYDPLLISETEQTYMRYFSVLPASEISYDILRYLFWIEEENWQIFDSQLNSLAKKGWLMRNADSFKCHQIIQEICREKLKPDGENCDVLISGLVDAFEGLDAQKVAPFFEMGLFLINNINATSYGFAALQFHLADRIDESGNSSEALKLFQAAIEIFTDLSENHNIAVCLEKMGVIHFNCGNRDEALRCYEEYYAIEKKLSDEEPDNLGFRFEIGSSLDRLGNLYQEEGNIKEAFRCARESIKITKALVKEDPANLEYKNGLAISLSRLGELYQEEGNSNEALKYYLEYNVIEKEISDKAPDELVFKNNLAVSFNLLGDIYRDEGDAKEALKCYLEYNNLQKELSEQDIEKLDYKQNLASSFSCLGDIYRDEKNSEEALKCYLENMKIIKMLSDKNPENLEYKNGLAIAFGLLGDMYREEDNKAEALKCYRELMEVTRTLSDKNQSNLKYKNNLATSLSRLGGFYREEGDKEEAFKCYMENMKIAKAVSDKNSGSVEYKENLAISLTALGELYLEKEDNNEALNCYIECNTLEKALSDKYPNNLKFKENLSDSYRRMGEIYRDMENREEALKCFTEYNKIETLLFSKNPDDPDNKNDLAVSYTRLSSVSPGNEKKDLCIKAINLWEDLVKNFPENEMYKENLALTNDDLKDM